MTLRDRLRYYIEHPEVLHEDSVKAAEADENLIREELRKQTPLFIDWSHLASLARFELAKAKRTLDDQIKPDLRDAIRAKLRAAGEKETIDRVDDQMKLTPIYLEQVRRLDSLQLVSDMLEDTADGLWERKGCLQSANARQGKELESYSS